MLNTQHGLTTYKRVLDVYNLVWQSPLVRDVRWLQFTYFCVLAVIYSKWRTGCSQKSLFTYGS